MMEDREWADDSANITILLSANLGRGRDGCQVLRVEVEPLGSITCEY